MKTYKLIDLCEKITDGSHYSPKATGDGDFPYVTVRDIADDVIDFDNCKRIDGESYNNLLKNGCQPIPGDLLFSKDGTVGKVSLVNYQKDFVVLSSLAIIRPDQAKVLPEYLFHILKSNDFLNKAIGKKSGAAIRRIILRDLKSIEITIHENHDAQRRIAANLDMISEKIDQASKLTEKNIENAKDLMYSTVRSLLSSAHGQNKVVGDILTLEYGKPLDKADRIQGGNFAAYGANGVKDRTHKYYWDRPSIIVGRKGSAGELTRVSEPFWPLDVTYYVVHDASETDLDYLYSLLKSLNLPSFARGVKPGINRNDIYSIDITLPTLEEQIKIAKNIDAIDSSMEKIIESYRHKQRLLRDMKQSMLRQAFSGSAVK